MNTPQSQRWVFLDVFRGMTILGMLIVNSPGNSTAYPWLEHAAWHGLTPADWIFPFFLFAMGMSLVLSLSRRLEQGHTRVQLLRHILWRSLVLFGLGLLLNGFPRYDLSVIRIPGVLQRIALCYAASGCLFLISGLRGWILTLGVILPGYAWMLSGDLTPEGSLVARIDRVLLSGHLYKPAYDPEGLLSTLPAVGTVIAGMLTARWIQLPLPWSKRLVSMGSAALVFSLISWRWNDTFPMNKALWTSSYVMATTALALVAMVLLILSIEVLGWQRGRRIFEAFGANAIAAYVLPLLLLKTINRIPVQWPEGGKTNLRLWVTGQWLETWLSPPAASLAFALLHAALWAGVFVWLGRRRLMIKV